ncbi:hypothetical protein IW262DRAFT_1517286 [Armillaria fumosa]|nr:hypothetical protein IW262DRAFT_1517286 [Armillaria fumosa]
MSLLLMLWCLRARCDVSRGSSILPIATGRHSHRPFCYPDEDSLLHLSGHPRRQIRLLYLTTTNMDMTYDTIGKDGTIKTLPPFADIDVRTPKYPTGLLYAIQFAQIALVVTVKAAFEDLREYAALATITDIFPVSSLVDVVFYRGITMQRAVEHDSMNRSNAMCAVNPSRVSKTFNDIALREVVDSLSNITALLLQIVNYNVEGQQYCLCRRVSNFANDDPCSQLPQDKNVNVQQLAEKSSEDQVKEMLGEIIKSSYEQALEQQKAQGYITLEHGFATIPLPGINADLMSFRAYLSRKINPLHVHPHWLVGRHIPNLTAKPFEVMKDYAQIIYDQTTSPVLDRGMKIGIRRTGEG